MSNGDDRAQEMARMYVEQNMTYAEIGEQYGLTRQRVHQILSPLGMPAVIRSREQERDIDLRNLYDRILTGETTVAVEAESLGIKPGSLYQALRRRGMKIRGMRQFPHGTRRRYVLGCSCDECRAAHNKVQKKLRGRTPPRHGTVSGYQNYGCTCQPCIEAGRAYQADQRRKRRNLRREIEQ